MATGDSTDFFSRLRSLVPGGWFAVSAPTRAVVMGGAADALAQDYQLLQSIRAITRVRSSTGWMLDAEVYDFFGDDLLRKSGESDPDFLARFIKEIFRERATLRSIEQTLVDLTGRQPAVFEPAEPGSCKGGYGVGFQGYGVNGYYGSLSYPNQIFITVYRPVAGGIPFVAGYGLGPGGYNSIGSQSVYSSIESVITSLSDDDIYTAIVNTVAAGVIPWTCIQS